MPWNMQSCSSCDRDAAFPHAAMSALLGRYMCPKATLSIFVCRLSSTSPPWEILTSLQHPHSGRGVYQKQSSSGMDCSAIL